MILPMKERLTKLLNFIKSPWGLLTVTTVIAVVIGIAIVLSRADSDTISAADSDGTSQAQSTTTNGTTTNEHEHDPADESAFAINPVSADVFARRIQEVQLSERIKQAILDETSDIISDCEVTISLGDALQLTEPSADVAVTLRPDISNDLFHDRVLRIVEIIKNELPNIKNEKITISDNHGRLHRFNENDSEITQWITFEDGFESMTVSSIEAANRYNSFSLETPSLLPDNASLDHVYLTLPGGSFVTHGVSIIYNLETDIEIQDPANWRENAFMVFVQYIYEEGTQLSIVDDFEEFPWSNSDPYGRIFGARQIIINDTEAVLYAYSMPVLLGEEAPADDFLIDASIGWYKGDIYYSLSVFAPIEIINLDMMIAIAESVG